MKEIISLHVGQAGVQMGNSCWELYCLEHGIGPDGQISKEKLTEDHPNHPGTLFQESNKQYTPRAVMVDLEPTVVDQARSGKFKQLFHPKWLISGKEDSANNHVRGRYTIGKCIVDQCLEVIRQISERCESLEGFMLYHSLGGGTGSGFGTLLLERLSVDYGKKPKLTFSVYPSPQLSTSIVEPYNAVLGTAELLSSADSIILLDNEALYDICSNSLDNEAPNYTDINRIIAQFSSSVSAGFRFEGALNTDMKEFHTNLVPLPRIKFLLPSYAPLISSDKAHYREPSVNQITKAVFEPGCHLVKCDPSSGRYLACSLMYRGNVIPKQINSAIMSLKNKKKIEWMDYSPTGFKIGISDQPPIVFPNSRSAKTSKALAMISNSTAAVQILSRLRRKYDLMFDKRAFVHWFVGEGIEDDDFIGPKEEFAVLQKEYGKIGSNISRSRFEDEEENDDDEY